MAPLKKYADFNGRARRKEYWWFSVFCMLISTVLGFIEGFMGVAPNSEYSIFAGIFCLAILVPSLAVTVRRLHDIGRRGWWMLIALVPIVGAIVLFAYLVKDSVPGRNLYGPNPKLGMTPTALAA
jgi:uncharacterized membrane protein YhaH (DUF805 family)